MSSFGIPDYLFAGGEITYIKLIPKAKIDMHMINRSKTHMGIIQSRTGFDSKALCIHFFIVHILNK
jgi:hypothetical protein